jgi:hypothetical protein
MTKAHFNQLADEINLIMELPDEERFNRLAALSIGLHN